MARLALQWNGFDRPTSEGGQIAAAPAAGAEADQDLLGRRV
jgi:hypothetical protein